MRTAPLLPARPVSLSAVREQVYMVFPNDLNAACSMPSASARCAAPEPEASWERLLAYRGLTLSQPAPGPTEPRTPVAMNPSTRG